MINCLLSVNTIIEMMTTHFCYYSRITLCERGLEYVDDQFAITFTFKDIRLIRVKELITLVYTLNVQEAKSDLM